MTVKDTFVLGDYNAVCFECGRKKKASFLVRHWKGYYVCPEHNESRQPQDFVAAPRPATTPSWTQLPVDVFVVTGFPPAVPYDPNAP